MCIFTFHFFPFLSFFFPSLFYSPFSYPDAFFMLFPWYLLSFLLTSFLLLVVVIMFSLLLFDTGSPKAQAGWDLTMYPRITLNCWSSCWHYLNAGITGICHHAQSFILSSSHWPNKQSSGKEEKKLTVEQLYNLVYLMQ